MRIDPELRPVAEMRKQKNIKKGESKSQNNDISELCGGSPCEPILIKFGVFLGLANIIIYTKLVNKFPLVFPGRQVEKRMFPYRKPTAYITLPCATALACDRPTLYEGDNNVLNSGWRLFIKVIFIFVHAICDEFLLFRILFLRLNRHNKVKKIIVRV